MDLDKIEPVFGGSNSISIKLWVWFLPKHTFHRVSLITPKNHELKVHGVILIRRNILAILDPLVLSIHFWFTFGFGNCISVSDFGSPKSIKWGFGEVSVAAKIGVSVGQK